MRSRLSRARRGAAPNDQEHKPQQRAPGCLEARQSKPNTAIWKNADDQAAGALQTVPNEPGTEIILESTARGFGNFFHRMWSDAERRLSDYVAIFIPWFGAGIPQDLGQMSWRRDKIRVLGDPLLFAQAVACYGAGPTLNATASV